MPTRRVLGVVGITLIAASALAVYFLYVNPPWAVDATVAAVLAEPTRFNDRDVRIQGYLNKTWFMNGLIHNLTDGPLGLPVTVSPTGATPTLDLDAYVGLKLLIEGRVRYRPQLLGGPKLVIEVKSVQVKEGSPGFFLQLDRSGGLTGVREIFMIDHDHTATFLSRAEQVWEKTLSADEVREAMRIINEHGFLTISGDRYEARNGTADYFTYTLKVVLVSGSTVESRTVTWVDEWASSNPLPENLTSLQQDLGNYTTAHLPAPYGATTLTVKLDKSRIVVGEYITTTVRVTNVARENQTFTISLPVFDLLLFDENGALFAKWSEGQAFPEVILLKTLVPGESYEEELIWNLYRFDSLTWSHEPPQPGTYYLQGVFRSLPDLQPARIRIDLAPR